jgi:hypothetical protein
MRIVLLALVAALTIASSAAAANPTYYVTKQQIESAIKRDGLNLNIGKARAHVDLEKLACAGASLSRGGRYHLWDCRGRSTTTGNWAEFLVSTVASGDSWSWTWTPA